MQAPASAKGALPNALRLSYPLGVLRLHGSRHLRSGLLQTALKLSIHLDALRLQSRRRLRSILLQINLLEAPGQSRLVNALSSDALVLKYGNQVLERRPVRRAGIATLYVPSNAISFDPAMASRREEVPAVEAHPRRTLTVPDCGNRAVGFRA